MNRKQKRKHPRTRVVLWAIALCFVLFLVALGVHRVTSDLRTQTQSSLKSTVLQCAVQCYAIEGAYPPGIAYLEENYGLIYNKKDYVVSYEAFASNEPPSVTVLARGTR